MEPKTTLAELTALVRRAGLPLSEAQIAELHRGPWVFVEQMLERNEGEGVDRFAEPAHVFAADKQ